MPFFNGPAVERLTALLARRLAELDQRTRTEVARARVRELRCGFWSIEPLFVDAGAVVEPLKPLTALRVVARDADANQPAVVELARYGQRRTENDRLFTAFAEKCFGGEHVTGDWVGHFEARLPRTIEPRSGLVLVDDALVVLEIID